MSTISLRRVVVSRLAHPPIRHIIALINSLIIALCGDCLLTTRGLWWIVVVQFPSRLMRGVPTLFVWNIIRDSTIAVLSVACISLYFL